MIDSLNLMIKNVKKVDFKNLIKLGGTFAKRYKNYTGSLVQYGYNFSYKNIDFKYSKSFENLLLIANPHKVLLKRDITLSDKDEFKKIIIKALKNILQTDEFTVEISRIDYYVDIPVNEKIKDYLNLLERHKKIFNRMKKTQYETSSYLKTKKGQGQIKLNFYDKYQESKKDFYKGILRLEIQNMPSKIKSEYKINNVSKQIDIYWSKECMEKYYFKVLEKYLYIGTYYKRDICKKLVDKAGLNARKRKNINRFSLFESRYKVDGVLEKNKFCTDTINNYIKTLNELGINPITIPKESKFEKLENLVKLARATAEAKYFK